MQWYFAGADRSHWADRVCPLGVRCPADYDECLPLIRFFSKDQFLSNAGLLPGLLLPCVAVAKDDINVFLRLAFEERASLQKSPLADLGSVAVSSDAGC